MAKRESSVIIVERAARNKYISESDILLLKNRMNRGEEVNLDPIMDEDVYVTTEQSIKGLEYLRKHFLTSKNRKRKNCKWGDHELRAIGYRGEGETLENLQPRKLFKFLGFMPIGMLLNYYSPIYEINDVAYYMECGEPHIY